MLKIAFFDIDGTLAAPYFLTPNGFSAGMPDEKWLEYNHTNKEKTYQWCKSIPQVVRYLQKLKAANVETYVLSCVLTSEEEKAKDLFISEKYPDLFTGIIYVNQDSEKVPQMKKICDEKKIDYKDCELIEDSFRNIIDAITAGFVSKHVTNIIVEDSNE